MAVAVEGVVHCNVNCSDLARSLAFYHERIGLRPLTHTAPEKPQDGSGFGLEGGARWDAWILHDVRGPQHTGVDLLEWQEPPPAGRPHASAHQLGLSRLGLRVPDVDALHASLVASGADCVTAPRAAPLEPADGSELRGFLCRDPDGTLLEIGARQGDGPRLSHVGVCCSELERSLDWYLRVLDLELAGGSSASGVDGALFGLAGAVAWEGRYLRPRARPDAFGIDLRGWREPRPVGPAYDRANHLGIYRMAFLVRDAHAAHEELRALGVECPPPVWLEMGPEVPVEGLWAVFFPDPDGTCLELIESPVVAP